MSKKRSKRVVNRPKIIVEPLEPRVLFSADVLSASLPLDLIEDSSQEQHNWLADFGPSEFTVSTGKGDDLPTIEGAINVYQQDTIAELVPDIEQSRQLIIIDTQIDDSEALLQDVISNGQSNTNFEIIRLVEGADGIEQITSALSSQADQKYDTKYDAVHIICLLYTSPSPRDGLLSRMPSSA